MYKKSLLMIVILCVGTLFAAASRKPDDTPKKDREARSLKHDIEKYRYYRKRLQEQAAKEGRSKEWLEAELDELAVCFGLWKTAD